MEKYLKKRITQKYHLIIEYKNNRVCCSIKEASKTFCACKEELALLKLYLYLLFKKLLGEEI